MKITIETIDPVDQRCASVGDWIVDRDVSDTLSYPNLRIRVSRMVNPLHEVLIGVHELIEAVLCLHRGIDQETVDKFDISFEKEGQRYGLPEELAWLDEPGDHPQCPYRDEHGFATGIERLLASALEIDWHEYEMAIAVL